MSKPWCVDIPPKSKCLKPRVLITVPPGIMWPVNLKESNETWTAWEPLKVQLSEAEFSRFVADVLHPKHPVYTAKEEGTGNEYKIRHAGICFEKDRTILIHWPPKRKTEEEKEEYRKVVAAISECKSISY